jgi:RNA polymerase sigma factor (sigma-70 family)
MTDLEILESIKRPDTEGVKFLYTKHRNYCLRFMSEKGLDENSGKDIYQDAVITFMEKVKDGLQLETATIQTYLNTICKYKLLNLKRKEGKTSLMERIDDLGLVADWLVVREVHEENNQRIELIRKGLRWMRENGSICYELLRKVYYEEKSMAEVAELLNYSNADVAKNQASRCRKQLKDWMKDK